MPFIYLQNNSHNIFMNHEGGVGVHLWDIWHFIDPQSGVCVVRHLPGDGAYYLAIGKIDIVWSLS